MRDKHSYFKGIISRITTLLAIFGTLFHLVMGIFGVIEGSRIIHVMIFTSLSLLNYLLSKTNKGKKYIFLSIVVLTCVLLVILASMHALLDYADFSSRTGSLLKIDVIMGTILVILVLLAVSLTNANLLAIFAIFCLVYGVYGEYFPGVLGHGKIIWERIIDYMYVLPIGIYGIPIYVVSSYIVLFLIFGALIEKSGMGKLFLDISQALGGDKIGGAAKVAVISNSLMGTVSGSATSNVVTTGVFVIPAMKKSGFESNVAAAITAVSSTGAMIMPPIMGAAAFLIASILGIKYFTVCEAALLPAVLYFASTFLSVHFYSLGNNLKGTEEIQGKRWSKVKSAIKERGHLLIPIIFLIYQLVIGRSISRGVIWSIIALLIVSSIRKESRMSLKDIFKALENAGKSSAFICVVCACAGIVIGIVFLTGIGLKFSTFIISLSGGNLFLVCVYTSFICLVLGMGLPATAAYITTEIICASAMIKLGVPPLNAHLFIFYYAILSNLTPPVMIATYMAASVAKSNVMQTGIEGVKIALCGYLIPFLLIYSTSIVIIDSSFLEILWTFGTAMVGIVPLAAGAMGYLLPPDVPGKKMSFILRLPLILSGFLLIAIPGSWYKIIGGLLFLIIYSRERLKIKNREVPMSDI